MAKSCRLLRTGGTKHRSTSKVCTSRALFLSTDAHPPIRGGNATDVDMHDAESSRPGVAAGVPTATHASVEEGHYGDSSSNNKGVEGAASGHAPVSMVEDIEHLYFTISSAESSRAPSDCESIGSQCTPEEEVRASGDGQGRRPQDGAVMPPGLQESSVDQVWLVLPRLFCSLRCPSFPRDVCLLTCGWCYMLVWAKTWSSPPPPPPSFPSRVHTQTYRHAHRPMLTHSYTHAHLPLICRRRPTLPHQPRARRRSHVVGGAAALKGTLRASLTRPQPPEVPLPLPHPLRSPTRRARAAHCPGARGRQT